VPEDFDPRHQIPIGPWCFVDREDASPGWEDLEFHDAVSSGDDVRRHALSARAIAESMVADVATRLNERHQRNHSLEYWRTLLVPWLLALSQVAWKRYLTVTDFVRRHGDESFEVSVCGDISDWNFIDTLDFAERGLIGHVFNYWLTSRIVSKLAPDHWVLVPQPVEVPKPAPRRGDRATLRGTMRRALGRFRFSGVSGAGALISLIFSAWLALRWDNRVPGASESSETLSSDRQVPPEFMALFSELVEATMPQSLGSRFTEFENKARKHVYRSGKVFVRGCVLWYDEDEKFAAAHALEAGEKLITVQHGGNYGIANSFPDAAEIEYKHAAFISWGWRRQHDHPGNVIPLPSPHLSRYRDQYSRGSDDLILVGTQQRIYSYRLDSSPQPTQWIDYRRQKSLFIEALEKGPRENLVYRPGHDEPSTLVDAARLRQHYPGLRFLEGALHPKILRCRLLVLDHPGTALNIALAANIPTVCYWRDDAWPVCREAEPVLARLRGAGLLFEGGREAAVKVNEVWHDPITWWRRKSTQDARKAFCDSYAKTEPFWWLSWLRTL